MTPLSIAQKILQQCQRQVPKIQAEVYLTVESAQEQVWSEGRSEKVTSSRSQGVGLRLIHEGRLGFGFLNTFDESLWPEWIQGIAATMASMPSDPHLKLPNGSRIPATDAFESLDPTFNPNSFLERASFLKEVDAQLAQMDGRLKPALRAAYVESIETVTVVSTSGVEAVHEGGICGFSIECMAVQGDETQLGSAGQYRRYRKELAIPDVISEAAGQAVSLLGSGMVPTGRYDIVLSPTVASEFLDLFVVALRADQVQKGTSFLKGRVGQKVVSDLLSFRDDPHRLRGVASTLFDAEGMPTTPITLIEKGVLKEYLFDSLRAAKAGRAPTGNAKRGSFKSLPTPGITNFYLEPGQMSSEKMIGSIENGIFVFSVMGLHTVDTITGEFSLGLMGQRIENGVLTSGVRGVTIAGNLLDFFSQVEAVGSGLEFQGSIGAPTLWIRHISIGGSSS